MGSSKGLSVISIDAGSSQMKAYNGRKTIKFPSVLQRLPPSMPAYRDELLVNGRRWLVGDEALREHDAEPHDERDFHGGRDQYVYMCYALAQLGAEGTYDQLVLSVPYGDGYDSELQRTLTRRKEFSWSQNNKPKAVTFKRVAALPQGVGALRLFQTMTEKRPELVTMVDIGSITVDVVTAQFDPRTGEYNYVYRACRSDRALGMAAFKQLWVDKYIHNLRGLQNREIGYHTLMNRAIAWVEARKKSAEAELFLKHEASRVSIREGYEELCYEFNTRILDLTREVVGALWPDLDKILVTGGGAEILDLEEWPRHTVKLDVWANVKGQYLMFRDPPPENGQEAVVHLQEVVSRAQG